MGTVLSYLSRKSTSQIESDPFEVLTVEARHMAEASYGRDPHSASQHAGRSSFTREELVRYSNALHTCQEFLANSVDLVERNTLLETELGTCQER